MHDVPLLIYGVPVRLRTDSDALARRARELVRRLPAGAPGLAGGGHEITLRTVGDPKDLPHRSSHAQVLVHQANLLVGDGAGEWTVSREGDRILVELSRAVLAFGGPCDVVGWISTPERMVREELDGYVFLALSEVLRQSGLYAVHAAGLERDGVGILVPGPSGAGKTTCLLALLQSGWRCLSDDHPLVRENGQGIELLPFPRAIKVTADTVGRFPAISPEVLREETAKFALDPEHLGAEVLGHACRPALLLFPQVVDWPHSSVEVLSRSRALEELMQLGLLVLDRDVAARHFAALARLVRETPCYRLFLGTVMEELPAVVDSTLEVVA